MQLLIGTIVVVVLGSFISALTVFSIKGNSSSFVFSLLISLMAGFLAIAIATSVISIQSRNFVEDFTFEYESANTVEQQKMIENLQGESFDINSVTPLKNGNFVFVVEKPDGKTRVVETEKMFGSVVLMVVVGEENKYISIPDQMLEVAVLTKSAYKNGY